MRERCPGPLSALGILKLPRGLAARQGALRRLPASAALAFEYAAAPHLARLRALVRAGYRPHEPLEKPALHVLPKQVLELTWEEGRDPAFPEPIKPWVLTPEDYATAETLVAGTHLEFLERTVLRLGALVTADEVYAGALLGGRIEKGVLAWLLQVPLSHGTRSLEGILKASELGKTEVFRAHLLPSRERLQLHLRETLAEGDFISDLLRTVGHTRPPWRGDRRGGSVRDCCL